MQPWCTLGGTAGEGSKEKSKGRAWGSDGRQSFGSTSTVELGRMKPAVARTGVTARANPSRRKLWAPILQMRTHLKTWSPKGSTRVLHVHLGMESGGKMGKRSLRLIAVVNSQLARRFDGTLRQRPMSG